MHIQTILKLAECTGTNYCARGYCHCGGDRDGTYPNLLFTNRGGGQPVPAWLPEWANAVTPEELYEWVQQEAWSNAEIATALRVYDLKRYRRFIPKKEEQS